MEQSLEEHPSLSDRIFEIIEKAILSGSIRPGERIIETELAKNLGTSKSPVREALKKLEGEGIVHLLPRKGFIVKEIDRKSVEDFCEVMFIVEPPVARLSLKRRDGAGCKKLSKILDDMKRSLSKKDFRLYLTLNRHFHGFFYELTENELITKIFRMLYNQTDIFRSTFLYTSDRLLRSMEEHVSIVEAYQKGDEKLLDRAVKHHLVMFRHNILKSDFLIEKP
ncbi:MAG: GntR family transcriptional regulator [Pseudomonadota bacterium]